MVVDQCFLDSAAAAVFLTGGQRKLPDVRLSAHTHRLLAFAAILSSAVMEAMMVGFFIYGPRVKDAGVDETLAALGSSVVGIFAWATRRRAGTAVIFHGDDAPAGVQLRPAPLAASGGELQF